MGLNVRAKRVFQWIQNRLFLTFYSISLLSQSLQKKKKKNTRWVYLVREVVAVHLVAVGLTAWTLNLDAVALQDGCFFKNTNLIIAYRPQAAR